LKNGVIKVMDFGIAKLPNTETMTLTDKAIGTVYYISPEQAEGKAIDQRSDLYSLGVMMYEMSCGKLPFYDESPISVALMQIKDNPMPPRNINPSIPKGLEQIILSAMEKDFDVRFQSATQMLRQIARLKADPGIVFKPRHKSESVHRSTVKKPESWKKRTNNTSSGEGNSMFPIILGVVSAFVVVLIASAIQIIPKLISSSNSTMTLKVPNVVGYTYTNQDSLGLNSSYYIVEIKEKYDSSSQNGQILEQNPAAGQTVKISKTKPKQKITLTVSLGAETIILENYENKSKRDAENALRKLGFKVEEQEVFSDRIAKGRVCYTYPAAGDAAVVGSTITIYCSAGGASGGTAIEVPELRGFTETEARERAMSLSLVIEEVIYETSDKAAGIVIGQSLLPQTSVAANSKITLTVSGGQSYIEKSVPNITGMSVSQAQAELSKYGLQLGERTEKASDLAEGMIIEQYPVPGTPISSGVKKINFVVSNGEYEAGHSDEFIDIDGWQVPNIIGMTVKNARKLLQQYELTLGTGTEVPSSAPIGTIVGFDIAYDDDDNPVVDYELSVGLD
ncbi:MAG: PASTA domain-containing protein, partial [Clostridia bacterium]|nr:PASTA domain-containing protein [Clostridia bacterium]